MQIVSISRGIYSRGEELAELVAKKMGYPCVAREELIEAAVKEGIQIGKLEMAMIKTGLFSERLSRERDHYLSFSTAYLCEKVMSDGLVYHGRSGHLLLPNVSCVLRVRVFADEEFRINQAMDRLGLERKKARRYIEDVDEDWRRWIHSMYNVVWEDAAIFDVIINLEQMSLENAASVIVNLAQLPDFQMTPASRAAIEDLHLAASTRVKLARDTRTHDVSVNVRSDKGALTVTYLPQDLKIAEILPEVCQDIPGVKDLTLTMAVTNVLWIQEAFQPDEEIFDQVVEIATKWNALVEMIRYVPGDDGDGRPALPEEPGTAMSMAPQEYNGGIEDDTAEAPEEDDGGMGRTLDALMKTGRSGAGRTVRGTQRHLINAIDRSIPHTLVIVGDLFLSKGHAAKLRAVRDLKSFLGDRLKAPVVTPDELGSQYLFGKRDFLRIAVSALLAIGLYLLVFSNQEPILAFLSHSGWYERAFEGTILSNATWMQKALVSLAVFCFIPIFASAYGTVTRVLLKLIKME